ncbi:MAG: Lrp/AsnC family transcriptional regulator [Rhizobiales bacterium]|nr:Lrp/AsnC family transcriptional regulator [Hyphomicrobiales bacterium]
MDRMDRAILALLQADSSQPLSAVADKAGLSLSACHRRVKLLEAEGVIRGYGARLNAQALGLEIEVFVEISLNSQAQAALERFEQAVLRYDEILECKLTSGASDYILRIVAENVADYDRIHRHTLARLPGVASMRSIFMLRSIKDWRGLPVSGESR